jgi:hypothetical protein
MPSEEEKIPFFIFAAYSMLPNPPLRKAALRGSRIAN